MAKTTPWIKIKAEYLQGVTPKELATKYKLKTRTISDKATKEKWTAEKTQICVNIREETEDKIKRITNLALKRLEDVLTDDLVKTSDLVSAIGKALDISGLKSSKQEITGKDGAPLATQKIYVTPQMQIEADKIIEDLKSDA